ncbi:hypothetical protein B9J77_04235 [candidate division NPL-UPA2 bacterium Unc8]|uniref:Glycosyl hydrolase family 4 C-terminal domain-containing protein n=1 Tax=candidate division NPL-UPA2 bacterium Unc8 TaxID=1980939 RepID=A0A399FWR5_UNCN2|nr:Alpha-glucosidase [Bacillota bacterium]RIH99859.1 MAG: hypothetical protein B9J77_04235 [candidate division NPL-UPA2 bacterium Unc8]
MNMAAPYYVTKQRKGSPKIVLIGAGSAQFTFLTVCDITRSFALGGSELILVDIEEEKLGMVTDLAMRLNEKFKAELKIKKTTDRRQALEGADFVISAVEVDRMNRWKMDCEIPLKHGIKQVVGECGGPGGISHSLRVIPMVVEICEDIQKLCPDALFINYTNPMVRVCYAVEHYTDVNFIGLCCGFDGHLMALAGFLAYPEGLRGRAAGLNHFSWIKELQFKSGGDAYPVLKEKMLKVKDYFQPVCKEMYHRFGLYGSPSDGHIAEFISDGYDICHPEERGYNWIKPYFAMVDMEEAALFMFRGEFSSQEKIRWFSDQLEKGRIPGLMGSVLTVLSHSNYFKPFYPTLRKAASLAAKGDFSFFKKLLRLVSSYKEGRAVELIDALLSTDKEPLELMVNVSNQGRYVSNLPQNAVVEVPALISNGKIQPLDMKDLPGGAATLCETQIEIAKINAEAALSGSRQLALQAMLLDPIVDSHDIAEKVLDELLWTHADLLPRFN